MKKTNLQKFNELKESFNNEETKIALDKAYKLGKQASNKYFNKILNGKEKTKINN